MTHGAENLMMKDITFSVGAVTFTYSLTAEQKKFLRLAQDTHVDLGQWPDFSENMTQVIQDAIPDSLKLPSESQLNYVRTISSDLNVPLPDKYDQSALTCLSFIADYKPAHDRVLAVFNRIRGRLLG
ncbi:hypothetical protein A1OK_17895 [Enterovibrio norvegicus FF-454]|uniref:Uncharacterized protein n=1 Tax=Enterovibrio norvegicus FF-454 TaxID=1185651 RepID=A0A1E5BVV3_9GAMM|nr:hypothetical protein [Enterovibrio norvegicus]OEE57378.1 hypothetical protein A1OK_17895 [Enterovibrio norvegicus FF-454]